MTLEGVRGYYALVDVRSRRAYVGKSKDLQSARDVHFSKLKSNKHPHRKMQRDFREHPRQFSFRVLKWYEADTPSILSTKDVAKNFQEETGFEIYNRVRREFV